MNTNANTLLEPGTYKLTHEVKNPSPDRRTNQSRLSSWESWAVWPAGMLFTVEADHEYPTLNRVRPRGGIRSVSNHDKAYAALVANLEPVQEQPSDYIKRNGSGIVQHYALGILDHLGVSVERVAEIMAQMDEEGGE